MVVRIYMDGIWDLFHYGHMNALKQGKTLFPKTYLIVGCCNDKLTTENKKKPVLNEMERYESLLHCRWIDEIIENAPWEIDEEFLNLHRIDYVAHDGLPYPGDVYKTVRDLGKFKEIERTENISTSLIIEKCQNPKI